MIIKFFQLPLIISLFLSLVPIDNLIAQNKSVPDSLLNSANRLFDEGNEQEALQAFKNVLEYNSRNFEALWHTSLLYSRIGFRMDDDVKQENYYEKALEYAEKTLEVYPDSGYTHFVYAVANGRLSDISDTKNRIRLSHVVKKHTQKATEMLPDYAPAWLLLGVWNSEVANTSKAQELAASVISEGIPEGASNEKAEEYIKKAIELDPEQIIRYKLDLARHYKRIGENEKAIQTLNEVLEEEANNEIEEWNLERARNILEELQ